MLVQEKINECLVECQEERSLIRKAMDHSSITTTHQLILHFYVSYMSKNI